MLQAVGESGGVAAEYDVLVESDDGNDEADEQNVVEELVEEDREIPESRRQATRRRDSQWISGSFVHDICKS